MKRIAQVIDKVSLDGSSPLRNREPMCHARADRHLDRRTARKYSNTPAQPQSEAATIAEYSSGHDENHQDCR